MLLLEVLHGGEWYTCDEWPNTPAGIIDARVYGRMIVADGRFCDYRLCERS